ncbi:MAG: TonB-dependent receptor [Mongoliibacter sp.]|uniref:TonB-dependent receptor n=1 Tax=Mongoliibacter sp. TaxID=2022438 RepID=UPI0012F3B9F3|nr:TonB-dependent receptor [Mongoliibacter sp.]TVP44432.1 MAG: TonB-dependent receptor [Mongoliibacter sp.]
MCFLYRLVIVLGCFFLSFSSFAQQDNILKGSVYEYESDEALPGANVYWESDPQKGVVTDINGNFTIPIIELPAKLIISFIGFTESVRLIQEKDIAKDVKFYLRPEELSLEEIIILERRPDQNVKSLDMGKSVVPIQTIKNIPALFGEVDLLRSLQLLPGVQTAGEGTTGLFVRGGSADQNLVQIDGAPIYNPSHFFGFFSVFNPDALEGVEFYKGNIPANLGGRLSSVIDVSLKEGNYQKVRGEGGIGTISSRLTVDGPLFSDKSSFVLSGRRTYADVFLRLSPNESINNNSLYFYDLSGKFTFKLGDRDKLSFSSYYGSDFLGLSAQFGFGWDNWVSSATWNRNINERTFFDLNTYHSRYKYMVNFVDDDNGFDWDNVLSETGTRAEWTFLPNESTQINWGFHTQFYHFAPINLEPAPGSAIEPIFTNQRNGWQNNVFIAGSTDINARMRIEAGLRWGIYHRVGRGVQYQYSDEQPSPESAILDTLQFSGLENMKFYQGLEPRVSMRYLLQDNLSIKAAYNRTFQYIQVATNNSAGLPLDRWVPADAFVPPIRADQISIGLFKNLNQDRWEISAETYYKDFKNLVDLRQGASVILTDNVETELLTGNGYAYGAEFLLRKNSGKSTGWLSYTYSRTWRRIEGISNDRWYNPRFDRPHDLTLVVNHEFNKRWSAGMTFIYTTGQAVTFPVGSYEVDNQRLPLYGSQRNADRFPDYHRMDASVTWKNEDKGRKWRGSWNFSIYNLYGRKNPFTYQFTDIVNGEINFDVSSGQEIVSRRPGVVMTYLFTFLPALTYNFQF